MINQNAFAKTRYVFAVAITLGCWAGFALASPLEDAGYALPQLLGFVDDVRVDESSGLAVSSRNQGILWTLNDSNDDALIYALDMDAQLIRTLRIEGVRNRDWEDMSSFVLNDKPWLLIADTGDNLGINKSVHLFLVSEPDIQRKSHVQLTADIEVSYPDGPHDCEAVAVDTHEGMIYLLVKRGFPVGLYRTPLTFVSKPGKVVLEKVAVVDNIPQPSKKQLQERSGLGRYASQPTAMDISRDGMKAVVLTYRHAYLYEKRSLKETWDEAFTRPPKIISLPPLPQAEAIAFGADSQTLYISSEKVPTPILRLQHH